MTQNMEVVSADPSVAVVERRKEYRLDIQIPISLSGIHPKTLESFKLDTVTQNVSRYGACVDLPRGYGRVGSVLELVFQNRFQARCRVVWIKESLSGMETLGLEFISTTGQWVLYN